MAIPPPGHPCGGRDPLKLIYVFMLRAGNMATAITI